MSPALFAELLAAYSLEHPEQRLHEITALQFAEWYTRTPGREALPKRQRRPQQTEDNPPSEPRIRVKGPNR
jgi:hypothetical protein